MGFFSSRKTDVGDNDYRVTAVIGAAGGAGGAVNTAEKSVVKVIRSRFYGKKGKEREEPITYIPQSTSVAQTLAIGSAATVHTPVTSSPLAGSSKASINRSPNSKRGPPAIPSIKTSPLPNPVQNERPLPPTPSPKKRVPSSGSGARQDTMAMPPPMTPVRDRSGDGKVRIASSSSSTVSTPSKTGVDVVTATLAQRLNELAVANADGLLNDDEYRILRQNLFERFSTASEIPSESPVVPAVRPRPKPTGTGPNTPERTSSRPLSNFQVEMPRPPSSQSRYSITSGVASLFRRTPTTVLPKDTADVISIWSQQSSSSSRWKLGRMLSRKSSSSSIQTTMSKTDKVETMSITSRRERGASVSRPETPHTPRRRLAAPPSSFPGVMKQQENRYPNTSIYNVFDEDHLSSAAEIRQEILAVEAEVKRLMDAFTGLEVTTLSKAQRSRGYSVTRSDAGRPSNVGSVVESKWSTEGKSTKRFNIGDSDAGSVRSANSAGTGLAKSVHSSRIGLRAKTSVTTSLALSAASSRPGSLRRKNSSSSMQSHGVGKAGPVAPIPALPGHGGFGQVNGANNSSVSLAKSGHIMGSVREDDARSAAGTVTTTVRMEDELEDGDEMEDIRRRREEVQMRYDGRLDYLRAKLKSAELHEKLLRK